MGHDISGFNKSGEEIAYARFSMSNPNASVLYNLLDANQFNGGVSGLGDSSEFSVQQMESALDAYNQKYSFRNCLAEINPDQKQIHEFITNCLTIAQKEGSVKVQFC